MWKICNSGAIFRATLLEISWNILKHKGNKSHFLKEINEWTVVKSLKNASHVAQVRNINNVVVNSSIYKGLRGFNKNQNMHNFAFRYKLDTSCKSIKIL